uniref:Uncharacterized protein n=1 Tax=Cannabis sativa TaxID=3483 RepID=A0A803NS31_CANSA
MPNMPIVYANYALSILPTPVVPTETGWYSLPKDWIKINCDVRNGRETMCVTTVACDYLGSDFNSFGLQFCDN